MEIMARMDDGTIREYAVPSYAGMSYTTEASEGVTTTFAAVDDVAAIGVAFAFDPERGGTVSRQIIPWAGRELAEDGPATVAASEDEAVCIITPEEAAHVTEVRVDGGVVFPAESGTDAQASADIRRELLRTADEIESLGVDVDDPGDAGWGGDGPAMAAGDAGGHGSGNASPGIGSAAASSATAPREAGATASIDGELGERLRRIIASGRPLADYVGIDDEDDAREELGL